MLAANQSSSASSQQSNAPVTRPSTRPSSRLAPPTSGIRLTPRSSRTSRANTQRTIMQSSTNSTACTSGRKSGSSRALIFSGSWSPAVCRPAASAARMDSGRKSSPCTAAAMSPPDCATACSTRVETESLKKLR